MENITDQSIPQSPFRDLGFHKERKRSKRHRRKRNHISAKDLVECVKAFAEHTQQVEKERKARYPKPVYN